MTESNTDTHTNTDTNADTTQDGQVSNQRFVERLAENYRPSPLGSVGRARFDANLHERLARRRPTAFWAPALGSAIAALVLAWSIWPATSTLLPQPVVERELDIVATDASWEVDVLSVDADAKVAEEDYLPDEYMAIAFVFIDEV